MINTLQNRHFSRCQCPSSLPALSLEQCENIRKLLFAHPCLNQNQVHAQETNKINPADENITVDGTSGSNQNKGTKPEGQEGNPLSDSFDNFEKISLAKFLNKHQIQDSTSSRSSTSLIRAKFSTTIAPSNYIKDMKSCILAKQNCSTNLDCFSLLEEFRRLCIRKNEECTVSDPLILYAILRILFLQYSLVKINPLIDFDFGIFFSD